MNTNSLAIGQGIRAATCVTQLPNILQNTVFIMGFLVY